jgi:hypothetical protein
MDIQQVADIIRNISEGFEDACIRCLQGESPLMLDLIKEQMYTGVDGNENHLTPTYDDDPYFNEPGYWYKKAAAYKAWKNEITPPLAGVLTDLPARPDNVPNLWIDGTFYSEVNAKPIDSGIVVDPGNGNGPDIVSKYGEMLLFPGPTAVEYFNLYKMLPAILEHFKNCGYK